MSSVPVPLTSGRGVAVGDVRCAGGYRRESVTGFLSDRGSTVTVRTVCSNEAPPRPIRPRASGFVGWLRKDRRVTGLFYCSSSGRYGRPAPPTRGCFPDCHRPGKGSSWLPPDLFVLRSTPRLCPSIPTAGHRLVLAARVSQLSGHPDDRPTTPARPGRGGLQGRWWLPPVPRTGCPAPRVAESAGTVCGELRSNFAPTKISRNSKGHLVLWIGRDAR